MVTGGVEPTQENLSAWINAGAFCVGMGSKLFPKDVVKAGNWQAITDKCKEALAYIAEAKKALAHSAEIYSAANLNELAAKSTELLKTLE